MKTVRLVGALLALVATEASAAKIVYTTTLRAAGSVGGQAIQGDITVKSVADTATKRPCIGVVSGCSVVINTRTTIDFAGYGPVRLRNPSYTFVNNSAGLFGYGEVPSLNPFVLNSFLFVNNSVSPFPRSPVFATYDLVSNLGPITTNGVANSFFLPVILTNRGAISFTPSIPSVATFQATLSGPVPEPATWALAALGFGLVGGAMRRRPLVRAS